jgi:hypothetical protein
MTSRVLSGVLLTVFTLVVGVIVLAVLLFSQLPDLSGFAEHPGHSLQRHSGRG